MTPKPQDLTERRETVAPIPGTERLPTTAQFDAIWNELLHDPHLAAVRKKLSIHDLRLLIGQITRSFVAADPATAELVTLRLLAQNADSVMETNRVMGERLLEQKALLDRVAEVYEAIDHWCQAYPTDIFPEPDWKKAHEVLTANGMTLDAISASCMRHVITKIGEMVQPLARDLRGGSRDPRCRECGAPNCNDKLCRAGGS